MSFSVMDSGEDLFVCMAVIIERTSHLPLLNLYTQKKDIENAVTNVATGNDTVT